MSGPLFAAEIPDFLLLPLKILAMFGAAAVGGWVLGMVAWGLAKAYAMQAIPPRVMWFIRTLGFVACGLLAYWWLFGGGGWFGAGGGPKDGVIPKKDETIRKDRDAPKEKDKDKEKGKSEKVTPEESLRVEVLGDAALKRITNRTEIDGTKRYRVAGKRELLTLAEVKELVKQRRGEVPALKRLEVVLYKDSPADEVPFVTLLVGWARDLPEGKSLVAVSHEPMDAPAN